MYAPRSILITGCSSGIGYTAAHALQQRGWRVIATARQPQDVDRLIAEGLEEALLLDLNSSESIQNAVDKLLTATGGTLDALFNNAAYGQPGAVEDLSRDTLRLQFETNLFGTHELTRALLPTMRRQGHGRIVMNSSLLGYVALPLRGAYNASKFALEGLSDTLRLELHGSGIKVVIIEPGPITSRFRANAFAMYQRQIDPSQSPFQAIYAAMERRLQKPGPAAPFTLPAEAILPPLIAALESRRPKLRYRVTLPAHLFATLRRLLPARWLDAILRGVSRGEHQ
jgi:NAD(P)-dependent dehydrogenase (short-subunit alcohol dehydrogenase family)